MTKDLDDLEDRVTALEKEHGHMAVQLAEQRIETRELSRAIHSLTTGVEKLIDKLSTYEGTLTEVKIAVSSNKSVFKFIGGIIATIVTAALIYKLGLK